MYSQDFLFYAMTMSAENLQNNLSFYDTLAAALQGPAAKFSSNFYYYGRTTEGLYFKLDEPLGYWLAQPVQEEKERRAALQEGRAWITLIEREPDGSDPAISDMTLLEPAYNIVRPRGLTGGPGEFVLAGMREALGVGLNLDRPLVYISSERKVVPDPLRVPFLFSVYNFLSK